MEERTSALLMAALGLVVFRILWSNEATFYVGPLVMRMLWVSVAILIGAGVWGVLADARTVGRGLHAARHLRSPAPAEFTDQSDHRHGDHSHGPPVFALLVFPVVIAAFVGPTVLGQYTVDRAVNRRQSTAAGSAPRAVPRPSPVTSQAASIPPSFPTPTPGGIPASTSPPVTPSSAEVSTTPVRTVYVDPQTGKKRGGRTDEPDEPAPDTGSSHQTPIGPPPSRFTPLSTNPARLTIYDYIVRASQGGESTLRDRRVSLVGFVSRDPDAPDGPWVLVRLKVFCCVADALPFMVIALDAPPPPYGTWVEVTGSYVPTTAKGDTQIKVLSLKKVPVPSDPYLW